MKEPSTNETGLPKGLTAGIIIVFAALVLGICLLIVFLYNLPVLFPPPADLKQSLGTRTPNVVVPASTPTLPPLAPTSSPTPSLTPSPTPGPAPAQPHGQVVFVTERMGFNSIFIMNIDGSGQRLLVPHNGSYYDYAPTVSPDGRRLAFSSNREKAGTDNIYVMDMSGSDLKRITTTADTKNASASWFPDNRRLAFTSNRSGRWQVYAMNDDGGGVRQIITSNDDIINVAVSPSGSLLAYTCGKEICLGNLDGTNTRVLLRNGLPKDHLAWSPDSSLITYTQANPNTGKTGIYVLDLQGNSRQIVANGGWGSWSPEGTRMVFSSDMQGVANLYLYSFETGEIARLTSTPAADIGPLWIR